MSGKGRGRRRAPAEWSAEGVRALRKHLGLSQEQMAEELGTRQQTVSEWETGRYRPRGASARLLSIIAEAAGFAYRPESRVTGEGPAPGAEPGRDEGG